MHESHDFGSQQEEAEGIVALLILVEGTLKKSKQTITIKQVATVLTKTFVKSVGHIVSRIRSTIRLPLKPNNRTRLLITTDSTDYFKQMLPPTPSRANQKYNDLLQHKVLLNKSPQKRI